MATDQFYGKISFEAGSASTDGVIKSQLDAAVATAENRANHTGTQVIATISDAQSYVDGRISTVLDIASAPSTLDTLNELAAALGDDPNYAATTATALGSLDTRVDALEAAGGSAGGYVASIGDGTASTYTVTHNLATKDVHCTVYRISDGQTVHPVITRPGTNTVGIDFGSTVPTTNQFRVLVNKAA
jgi:hypothetical protein